MKFVQDKASDQKTDIRQNFKQVLYNFPKLPLPKSQLTQIYDNYLQLTKIKQQTEELLAMVLKANEEAILKEFLAFMNKLFYDLDLEFTKINSTSDMKYLNHLVQSNFPSFILKSQIKPISKAEMSVSNSKLNQTPGNPEQQCFKSPQEKVDFIFSYLFEQIHHLILGYKEYYQMDNVDSLESVVCQCFSSYVDENKTLFFPKEQQIKEELKISKILGSKVQQEQENQKQKQKSAIVNNIIDIVIENAQDANIIRKLEQGQANKRQQLKINNYEVKPHNIVGKGISFFQSIYKKGLSKTIAGVFHYARDMSMRNSVKYEVNAQQEEMVLKLADTILKSHIRHNVNQQSGLQAEEFRLVQEFINLGKSLEDESLNHLFTQNQKQIIVEILFSVIQDQESSKVHSKKILAKLKSFAQKVSNLQVKQPKSSIKVSSKKGIKTTLSTINTLSQLPNTFYLLQILFRELQDNYCPYTRRLMLRICHGIEQKFKENKHQNGQCRTFCLVHVLKLLQSQKIKRSQVCNLITNQKPFRQSQLPLKNQKSEYFEENTNKVHSSCEEAQLHLELQINRLHIFEHKNTHKDPAKMQLLKLSHSTQKKTVTILVSGFLSEDTNKFQEWMGVLEPTYDSEIYALKWESKTIEHILQFTINACKDIALTGAGIGFIGGPFIKAALVIKEILKKYHENPFVPCFQVATITGIYLADLLINLFDGHFINLVGFSLGTQVIASALEQFKKRGKLHMINRFVTLGGVADRLYIAEILDTVQQNQENPISIAWTNVYCERDNILRYLLRISMPSIEPIGLIEIKQEEPKVIQVKKEISENDKKVEEKKTKIYEVDNINVTEFVNGHLTYRANMKNIARLLGIKDQ